VLGKSRRVAFGHAFDAHGETFAQNWSHRALRRSRSGLMRSRMLIRC
jgi:hypothetical protein